MVYCPNCGTQNPDDAKYCNNCGYSLTGEKRDTRREMDRRCEEACSGRTREGRWLWAIILIVIGLWIIFEVGLANVPGLPNWVYNLNILWIIPVIIGIIIVIAGIRVLIGRRSS